MGHRGGIELVNCVFSGNRAIAGGGALYIRDVFDDPSFVNCTFVNNSAPRGTAIYNEEGMGSFANCIFVNGGTDEFREVNGASMRVRYSSVQGGRSGEGNIDEDPRFRAAELEDFRLLPDSPCIDSASVEGPGTDLDGNPRPIDIPGVGRDGEGAFDMGAYEYQPPTKNPRSDINEDGIINAEDLLILLKDWQKVTGT